MAPVRFSVVIPTRERAATLRHALATCLDQDFDDYEVIVSDNASSPATKAVVDEAASPRVRYVRTPEPLAMSSNWDLAVSHARGEYVVLIGDDDGLLPHALKALDSLCREHTPRAVRWEPAYYTWPSFALAGQENYLRVPTGRGLRDVSAQDAIRGVIAFRDLYTALPMLYNAAVHRGVLDELRATTGRVFPHPVPDVYSGFAVAAVAGRFLSTDVPMSVAGQSGASNGVAVLFNRGRSAIDREFRELNAKEGLLSDPRIPDLPVFPHVPVADAFAFAKKKLFPDSPLDFDRKQFVAGCLSNLRVRTAEDWNEALKVLRESLGDDQPTRAWFDAECANTPFREPPPPRLRPDRLGFDGEFLHLDAAGFGVADVAAAAGLCERLLDYRRSGVRYLAGDAGPSLALAAKVQELNGLCAERQQVIDGLHRVCAERLAKIEELDARLREALRGGPLKRAGRWVKHRLASGFGPRAGQPKS
jgi:glycosyltransferase involved in cell wall biosynthesis